MTNQKHTPGPWEVGTPTRWMNRVISVHKRVIVADVVGTGLEPEANAQLIATAPDLLEACKTFMSCALNGKHPGLMAYANTTAGEEMKQAIVKAEGK